jgi:hypothetical protein
MFISAQPEQDRSREHSISEACLVCKLTRPGWQIPGATRPMVPWDWSMAGDIHPSWSMKWECTANLLGYDRTWQSTNLCMGNANRSDTTDRGNSPLTCRPLYCVGWACEAENPPSTTALVLNWYWTVCGRSSCSHPLSGVIRTPCGRFRVPYSSALLTITMVESGSFTMVLPHYWSSILRRN